METSLLAGFGRSDITPAPDFPSGMWMAQKHARAEGVHRPLYINCIIVGTHDENAVAIVNYDLTILSPYQINSIKDVITDRTGISGDRIWLYVTHNHAGPVTQDFYDREGADEVKAYIGDLIVKSGEAALQAWESRRPSRVGGGSGTCNIGINRDLDYNGRVVTGPNFDGFTDPEVGVLRFDDLSGKPIASIVSYACHPTYLGPENKLVSPDFPGVTRDIFEEMTETPCVFLQAGGGNVGPLRGFLGPIDEVEKDGKILACEAVKTFLTIETEKTEKYVGHVIESGAPLGILHERVVPETEAFRFGAVSATVMLPTDNPGPTVYDSVEDDLEAMEAQLRRLRQENAPEKEIQHTIHQRLRHKLRLDRKNLYFGSDHYGVNVCALRMGDICFVSVGCEAYAEIAVAIREKSPFARTIFASYEGPDVIYIAPGKYYAPPVSMEVFNSPFGPAGADILVSEVLKTLDRLM